MGATGDVILLWPLEASLETCPWRASAPPGVRVALVEAGGLAVAVPVALARGPVVAVVTNDRQAHRALALGVDEVVRASEASVSALAAAVERAKLRAFGRESRQPPGDADSAAIELMANVVSCRLADQLAVASANAEILRTAMGAVAGLADAYTRDAAFLRNLGDTDVQRVVALRASAPATPELHATMNELTTALREASVAVTHVYSLLGHDGAEDVCELTAAISEVARLVRIVIERIADFRLELPEDEPLHVAMSRAAIVQGVSGLLTAALRAVRDREERGTITLRVEPRADVAIVEVIDNGAGMSPYVLEQALEPEFAQNPAAPPGLAEIADRIRSAGGELVLESQQGVGTTARIFVPMLPRHEQPKPQVS